MSVFDWKGKPSQSGRDLGRVDVIRAAASKTVEENLKKGKNLGLIANLSKKAQVLSNRHCGQFSMAKPQEKQK